MSLIILFYQDNSYNSDKSCENIQWGVIGCNISNNFQQIILEITDIIYNCWDNDINFNKKLIINATHLSNLVPNQYEHIELGCNWIRQDGNTITSHTFVWIYSF